MQISELSSVPPPTSNQERTPGVHLTDLLNARELAMGEEGFAPEPEETTQTRFALGFAWELAIERALNELWGEMHSRIIRVGEVELDGVLMTPDAVDVADGCLEEWKCSKLSSQRDPGRYRRYITQMMCYCHALGLTEARLRVLHLNGDYREERGPLIKSWRFEFEVGELETNWGGLVEFARKAGIL